MKNIALIAVPLLIGVLLAVQDKDFSFKGLIIAGILGGLGAVGAVYLVSRKKSSGRSLHSGR
jgi:hypothetical protein